MACSKFESTNVIRCMMVGKTGSGKSSSVNMIVGESVVTTSGDLNSESSDCFKASTLIGSRRVEVIDTPGLFDTSKSHDEVGLVIIRCFIDLHPGLDVVFVVLRYGDRYTEEHFAAYRRLKALFGSQVTQRIIVLFTGGDILKKSGKTMEEILKKAPANLISVLDECGWRYVVLDNELTYEEGRDQVRELLEKVEELRKENKYTPFVCKNYSHLGKTLDDTERLKKEVAARLQEVEAQETRVLDYVRQKEEEFQQKLDELDLTKEEYTKQAAAKKKELEEEFKRMMDEWEKKKAEEEKEMQEKQKQKEKKLKEEMEEHERKMKENEAKIKSIMEEQQRQHEKQMEEKEAAHRIRLEEYDQQTRENLEKMEKIKKTEGKYQVIAASMKMASSIVEMGGNCVAKFASFIPRQ